MGGQAYNRSGGAGLSPFDDRLNNMHLQSIASADNEQMNTANGFFKNDAMDDFARMTHFDRSNAFGFGAEDKLGKLAEMNQN